MNSRQLNDEIQKRLNQANRNRQLKELSDENLKCARSFQLVGMVILVGMITSLISSALMKAIPTEYQRIRILILTPMMLLVLQSAKYAPGFKDSCFQKHFGFVSMLVMMVGAVIMYALQQKGSAWYLKLSESFVIDLTVFGVLAVYVVYWLFQSQLKGGFGLLRLSARSIRGKIETPS